MYENAENRRKYAAMRAEKLGVKPGPVEEHSIEAESTAVLNYDCDFS